MTKRPNIIRDPAMNFLNNPFEVFEEIIKDEYPDIYCSVVFGSPTGEEGELIPGFTLFPDDGSAPVVKINYRLGIWDMAEVLGHELAHVIAGIEAGHGPAWEKTYDNIHAFFVERTTPKEETDEQEEQSEKAAIKEN